MALGNSNSSAQSRGKNKPVIVKRTKEIFLAKDFHAISGSLIVPSGNPCGLHNGLVTQTYHHSATNAAIGASGGCQVGTFIFTRKRAHEDFHLPDGNYKVTQNGSNYFAISIQDGQIKSGGLEACK